MASPNSGTPFLEDEVLASVRNGVGTLVLNRPRVLNSLSFGMVKRICSQLDTWSQPAQQVACVIIKGAGGKAFCAGGDVKACVLACGAGQHDMPDGFFTTEYSMDLQISRLRMPYVAVIDGIVMGGGAGTSMHGTFRVATERTVFAMPECAIGLFPDVGASFFLNRLPGHLGMYLAVTGARLTGVTVREAGLATHYLPSSALPELEARLHALGPHAAHMDAVARLLDELEASHGPKLQGDLPRLLPLVNLYFSQPSVATILHSLRAAEERLQQQPGPSHATSGGLTELDFVQGAVQMLTKGSPLSQAITFQLMQRALHAPLVTCLESDTAMIAHFVRGQGDFVEGVTAMLIDKRPPVWKYSSLDKVPPDVVESFFASGPFARRTGGTPGLTRGPTSAAHEECCGLSQGGATAQLSRAHAASAGHCDVHIEAGNTHEHGQPVMTCNEPRCMHALALHQGHGLGLSRRDAEGHMVVLPGCRL